MEGLGSIQATGLALLFGLLLEPGSHVAQVSLELTMKFKMALNS